MTASHYLVSTLLNSTTSYSTLLDFNTSAFNTHPLCLIVRPYANRSRLSYSAVIVSGTLNYGPD